GGGRGGDGRRRGSGDVAIGRSGGLVIDATLRGQAYRQNPRAKSQRPRPRAAAPHPQRATRAVPREVAQTKGSYGLGPHLTVKTQQTRWPQRECRLLAVVPAVEGAALSPL